MSKQTRLDDFISKKTKNTKPNEPIKQKKKHVSSRQASEETVRLPQMEEQQVKLQIFQKRVSTITSCPLLAITPNYVLHFQSILSKLNTLQKKYGKEQAISYIEGNLRFHKIQNVRHLQDIKDDQFWGLSLPKLIQILISELPKIDIKYRRLLTDSPQVIDLTRLQILVILGSMLLGIMPKQPHENCVSFGELMQRRQNEYNAARADARREKLKCIIAYFNIMAKNDDIYNQNVRIQRTSNRNHSYLETHNMEREQPLRNVRFQHLDNKGIEDFCGKGLMVDFANKMIGGGVLKNGCVQEEILFAIFPQLIITKILCEQLDENEAIIIYGARRFADYSGYSDSFKFEKQWPLQNFSIVQKSIMIAIDAIDFSKYPTQNYQYSKRGIRREINKAFTGFEGASMDADQQMPVCTGKWGCGAFKGNEDLKFLIQWLAASEASRQMIYICSDRDKQRELRLLFNELLELSTLDLLSLLDEYNRFRGKEIGSSASKLSLLDYIKKEV